MGEPGNHTHPEAPGDTDHPIFYNLPSFPVIILHVFLITMRVEGTPRELCKSGITCLISPYVVKLKYVVVRLCNMQNYAVKLCKQVCSKCKIIHASCHSIKFYLPSLLQVVWS